MYDRNTALKAKYNAPVMYGTIPSYEDVPDDYKREKLTVDLPPDKNVPGFAPGMDDIAQIVLNNNKDITLNRNLVTEKGANYWTYKKNMNIANPAKHWKVAVADINQDNKPEVLIKDGKGDIRYINGYHLSKSKNDFNRVYQDYLWDYGNPAERARKKALGQIPKGELSKGYFLNKYLEPNPDDPDGPLVPTGPLRDIEYQTKALSTSNLFLRAITKPLYDTFLTKNGITSKEDISLYKRLLSVLQLNAMLYKQYITIPVAAELKEKGITMKQAKKKDSSGSSPYKKMCLEKLDKLQRDGTALAKVYQDCIRIIKNVVNNQVLGSRQTLPEVEKRQLRDISRSAYQPIRIDEGINQNMYEAEAYRDQQVNEYNSALTQNKQRDENGAIVEPLDYSTTALRQELLAHPKLLPKGFKVSANSDKPQVFNSKTDKYTDTSYTLLFNTMIAQGLMNPNSRLFDKNMKNLLVGEKNQ